MACACRGSSRLRLIGAAIAAAIIAAPVASAAQNLSEDVPVPGGLTTLARALRIDAPDPGRAIAELARLAYGERPDRYNETTGSAQQRLFTYFDVMAMQQVTSADRVPIPLPARIWSAAVFRRPVTADRLFVAVLTDRNAALLAHGLAALDDDTLAFLAQHPSLVTRLYERHAAAFASFAAQLRIRDGRVVPPGGNRAHVLWEAVIHERVTSPASFVEALFRTPRLAYLYDVIGHLDDARMAFVLGLWIQDPAARVTRFKRLAAVVSSSFDEWNCRTRPFSRPTHDLLILLLRVHVTQDGTPRFGISRSFWERAVADDDGQHRDAVGVTVTDGRAGAGESVDAAVLAEVLLSRPGWARMDTVDQFGYAQRMLAASAGSAQQDERNDLLVAVREFPKFRMVLLTAERMGVTRAQVHAALVRHARTLSDLDRDRGYTALAQFQGAIALVARMAQVRTIDTAIAETLLVTLASAPIDRERGYRGAIAGWLQQHLRPALTRSERTGLESVLVEALAGVTVPVASQPVSWEGQRYAFDPAVTETARLRQFRTREGGVSLDDTLELYAQSQAASPIDDAGLARVDAAVADALLTFTYAVYWNPHGTARFARNIARRHDFGLSTAQRDARVRLSWSFPNRVFKAGEPWHVKGSLLGLDVAFASLLMRKVEAHAPAAPPAIVDGHRDAFASTLGLLDPVMLQNVDLDAVAGALIRGQQRVATLLHDAPAVDAAVREIRMDGWRERALRWTLAHRPQDAGSLFTTVELIHLGGGSQLDLRALGTIAINVAGCVCTEVLQPGLARALVGRTNLSVPAASMADLTVRVAVMLRQWQLPAALTKDVLALAVPHLLNHVRPVHADDMLAVARAGQALPRERIEDYVAAATVGGPLVPITSPMVRQP